MYGCRLGRVSFSLNWNTIDIIMYTFLQHKNASKALCVCVLRSLSAKLCGCYLCCISAWQLSRGVAARRLVHSVYCIMRAHGRDRGLWNIEEAHCVWSYDEQKVKKSWWEDVMDRFTNS